MQCKDGIVKFSPAQFRKLFPDVTEEEISDAQLRLLFLHATTYVPNDNCAALPCDKRILFYSYMILNDMLSLKNGALVVGRVLSATQGSVSVGLSAGDTAGIPAPYNLSLFGIWAWDMIRPYFTGVTWVGANRRGSCCNPPFRSRGRHGGRCR